MRKLTMKAILVIVGLGTFGYAAAGGGGIPSAEPPVIVSTSVDFKNNVLVISCRYFGSTAPTVRLADQILKVKSFSTSQIIASLPAGIQPATYSLTVSTTSSPPIVSETFNTALFDGKTGMGP